MVFITILLFAVAYIFAIVGVVFFESYSIPDRPDLSYHHSFRYTYPVCEEDDPLIRLLIGLLL